ncbi:TarH domain-containing protein [Pseudomonas sp. IT-P44]
MSINLLLLLLIGTGLLTAVIMSLVSYLGNSQMATAVNDNEVSMTALRNHLEADMLHDALRADVLSALAGKLSQSVDRFRL